MQMTQKELETTRLQIETLARRAGDIAMSYFRSGERTVADVSYKGGGSPVTEADLAVDRFLLKELQDLFPDAGWLSEETADTTDRLGLRRLIVVDPIDGTLAYARGDDRWAVSIALIDEGRPVVGVIHAPALGETYIAARGLGAFLNGEAISVSDRDKLEGAKIVAPRGLTGFFETSPYNFRLVPRTPSLALRIADVATGKHDLAIAARDSRDWDIAAADIILAEAGGLLTELEGEALTYNRRQAHRDMLVAAPRSLFEGSLALAIAASKGSS
jgi:myo-inositol-1(or 4)-monophosphatase